MVKYELPSPSLFYPRRSSFSRIFHIKILLFPQVLKYISCMPSWVSWMYDTNSVVFFSFLYPFVSSVMGKNSNVLQWDLTKDWEI